MSRSVPIVLFLLAFAPPIPAADEKISSRPVFALATEKKDKSFKVDATNKPPAGWKTEHFRPNTAAPRVYHLYVFNPTDDKDTFVVTLDGFAQKGTAKDVNAGEWARVEFAAAAPSPAPAAVPPAVPAPAAGATPPPAVEPLPPGRELTRTRDGFPLKFRLFHVKDSKEVAVKDDKPTKPADKDLPFGYDLYATLPNPFGPNGYLDATGYRFSPSGAGNTLDVAVTIRPKTKPKDDTKPNAPDELADPQFPASALKLSFPKFATARPVTRDGVYQRSLAVVPESAGVPSVTVRGTATDLGATFRADVAADGFERALILRAKDAPAEGGKLQPDADTAPAIRVYPTTAETTEVTTKPTAAFPVRLEVDNPPADAAVELRYHTGDGATPDGYEVIRLDGPRQERLWVDLTPDGVGVSTRSKDWVKTLNLADARGAVVVEAVLKYGESKRQAGLVVRVDATPPELVRLAFADPADPKQPPAGKPLQLEKGKPLKLWATAADADSAIKKAVFFLGVPTDDDKLPPDAVQVKGDPVFGTGKEKGKVVSWTAALPLPADRKGELLTVGVIVTDAADNPSPPVVQKIELVEPGKGGDAAKPGSVVASVVFGDAPQPGLTVTLADADGKPKDAKKTNDKGKVTFEKVPPGAYKLSVSKTDFSTGLSGAADVTVEADKAAKATVELKKNRK